MHKQPLDLENYMYKPPLANPAHLAARWDFSNQKFSQLQKQQRGRAPHMICGME